MQLTAIISNPIIILNIYLLDKKYFYICTLIMVDVAQLVRALVCGAGSRGFETHLPPVIKSLILID